MTLTKHLTASKNRSTSNEDYCPYAYVTLGRCIWLTDILLTTWISLTELRVLQSGPPNFAVIGRLAKYATFTL